MTGLLFGTGEDGYGLELWDAATGERLRTSDQELAWHAEQTERARAEARREADRAAEAEERAEIAERRNRELRAEIERLKARMKE